MKTYEVEIKSLLGTEERAAAFRSRIQERGAQFVSSGKQLNHYFVNGDFLTLQAILFPYFNAEQQSLFQTIISEGDHFSVRLRDADGVVLIVIKATTQSNTSENGVARMEFEEMVPLDIDALGELLVKAGFDYQAKWSRTRETYIYDDMTITLDYNAGYGWLTELELMVTDASLVPEAEARIRSLMESLEISELDQDRLARMFSYYNANWKEYYGTNNIFTIE